MKHFSEEELIAYQLDESSERDAIRRHLEECAPCEAMSDSIAETLRVFSAEPVPEVDLEYNWQRVRGHLTVLETKPRFGWLKAGWMWGAAGIVVAAVLVIALLQGVTVRHVFAPRPNYALNGHGPLTTQPVEPAVAGHLDAAERLLTEVNHASGPLDDTTRSQAHALLLKNAVYVSDAHTQGDVAEAAVLENLGRVLTTIDNEPEAVRRARSVKFSEEADAPEGVGFRLEMNTSGLLLEIRILRQNDDRKQ
ncbi:MAG: hypothetical protein JWM43_3231 [Acidobacteriaceae bacterium]|nr:hypothetical protein [Acidobacteriaceae bacterium]